MKTGWGEKDRNKIKVIEQDNENGKTFWDRDLRIKESWYTYFVSWYTHFVWEVKSEKQEIDYLWKRKTD